MRIDRSRDVKILRHGYRESKKDILFNQRVTPSNFCDVYVKIYYTLRDTCARLVLKIGYKAYNVNQL